MLFKQTDFREAYDKLLKRGQKKTAVPLAFRESSVHLTDPKLQSLLPVGTDSMTTKQVEKNPAMFFNEIERLVNQCEPATIIPRINFKKYLVVEKFNPNGKARKIVKLCLRDQVIKRAILKKLTAMQLISGDYDPNVKVIDQVTRIQQDLLTREGQYTIVRTDIQNFYPSVNIEMLLDHFRMNCCRNSEALGIYHLLRKALGDNKSKEEYIGLPIGMSVSGLLAEYYLSMVDIHDLGKGIKLYRFSDDCLFVLDQQIDAAVFLEQLRERLGLFNLKCSPLKTFTLEKGAPFDFLGVHFENGKVCIDDSKMENWRRRVKEDIVNEFKYYTLTKAATPGFKMPSNRSIVRKVSKEHYNGKRSRMWEHSKKIEQLNKLVNEAG